jgi:4-methyl-5(b-hydroxyethyl)-thiazole monophosphate biosynthesis
LQELLIEQNNKNKYVAAICASPAVVLAELDLLKKKHATCYPAPKFKAKIHNHSNDNVVVDGNIITSQGK